MALTHLPVSDQPPILFVHHTPSDTFEISDDMNPTHDEENRILSHSIKRKSETNSEAVLKTIVFDEVAPRRPAR
jgi:hypothetical protein